MFKKIASNTLIESADDCYIESIKDKDNKEELESIAQKIASIAGELVEGDLMALLDMNG